MLTRTRVGKHKDIITLSRGGRKPRPASSPDVRHRGAPRGHCILLHGWQLHFNSGHDMDRLRDALAGAGPGWLFWTPEYDTRWQSFKDAADKLSKALRATGHDFSNTLLIGYSLGGLVARQMAANGFPCKALISICTPHRGTAPWVPTPDAGALSMAPGSKDLDRLNSSAADYANRQRLHCYGINYHNDKGLHQDDNVVTLPSALGEGLGPVAHRHTTTIRYTPGLIFPGDPHQAGMDPEYMRGAVETGRGLLKRYSSLRQVS